jgi:hypothetical protein
LNRGRSPSGNGNARTIDIIAIVRIRVCNLDRPMQAEWTPSKMLCTSNLPHQRNDDLMMPTVDCVWKISGDMLVMGSYGKKMDG